MSEVIKWRETTVDVRAQLVSRYLWSTASIDVYLDELCILRTGGQFKGTGSQAVTFTHSGEEHKAELSWGVGLFLSFPYKLRIDAAPVSEGRVRVRNWPIAFIGPIILAILLFFVFRHFRHLSPE